MCCCFFKNGFKAVTFVTKYFYSVAFSWLKHFNTNTHTCMQTCAHMYSHKHTHSLSVTHNSFSLKIYHRGVMLPTDLHTHQALFFMLLPNDTSKTFIIHRCTSHRQIKTISNTQSQEDLL